MIARRIGAGLAGLAVVVLGAGPCLAASSPWTLQSAPPSGDDAFLLSVSADSNTDAWAVGAIDKSGAQGPLIFLVYKLDVRTEAGEPVIEELQTRIVR